MCGRFALWTPPGTITRYFNVSVQLESAPRYNIAPGQDIIAIRQPENDNRKTAYLRWGLIPKWAKEEKIGYKMINARAETLFDKTSFSSAALHRRCLIPVSGFYEWQKNASGKQPYMIRLKATDLFALAGIWESWRHPESSRTIETCTIVTAAANSAVRTIHHRMPVIVDPEYFDLWLDSGCKDAGRLKKILTPWEANDMICNPVRKAVNNTKNDYPGLLNPEEKQTALF